MTARLRAFLRSVGEFFEFVEPEPPRLACKCLRSESVIVGCLHCDFATCEQHRTEHECIPEGVSP